MPLTGRTATGETAPAGEEAFFRDCTLISLFDSGTDRPVKARPSRAAILGHCGANMTRNAGEKGLPLMIHLEVRFRVARQMNKENNLPKEAYRIPNDDDRVAIVWIGF